MELPAILIGAGVFVLSGVLIYIISALTMREKTYEEVLAEQRKKKEEIMLKSKQEKKDKTKKKKGGKSGKKDKSSEGDQEHVDGSQEEDHKMVQYELDPEIIQPQEASTVKQRKTKKEKQKPILVNKDEKPLVKNNMETTELYHKQSVPLDDLELKHERQRRDSEKSHDSTTDHLKLSQKEVTVEQVISQSAATVSQTTPKKSAEQSKKSKRKSTQDHPSGDSTDGHFAELLSQVQTAQLGQYEIQALTDELLSKQAAPQQWTKNSKKADPVTSLSKQLADQTAVVDQAKAESQAANLKMKELKQELFMEKQRFSILDKQSREQVENHRAEVNALHSRMQQTHEQHVTEKNTYRMQLDQVKMNEAAMTQLREENRQLKQANQQAQTAMASQVDINGLKQQMKILQDELSKNVLKLNASDNAKQLLEVKVSKYEGEIQKLKSAQRDQEALMSKLNEASENVRRSQARNDEMKREMDKMINQTQKSDQEAANLRNTMKSIQDSQGVQLQESERQKQQLQSELFGLSQKQTKDSEQLKELQSKLSSLEKIHQESEQTLLTLTSEKAALSTEIKTLKDNANDIQHTSAPKVDSEALQKAEAAHRTQTEDIEKQFKAKIEEMTKELAAQKEKNNALRERNWKAMDALNQAEKRAEKCVQLQDELESKDKSIEIMTEQLKTIERNQADLETKFNNDLTSKTSEIEQLSRTIKDMQQEKSQLTESATKSSALWDQLQQLQTDVTDKDAQISKLLSQLEASNKQNQDLASNAADSNGLQNCIKDLETTLSDVKSQLQVKVGELQSLTDENDVLKKHNTNLEKQKQAIEEGQFDSEEQLHTEIKHLETQLKDQVAKLSKANETIDSLNAENQELQQSGMSSSTEEVNIVQIHTQEINILQTSLQKKSAEMEVLQQALTNREKRIKELERRTDQIYGPTYTKLLEDIRDKNCEISNLQKKLKSDSSHKNELSNKVEAAENSEAENVNKSEELQAKTEELDQLLAKLQQNQEDIAKRDNEIKSKDNKLSELDGRLQSTQAELQETAVQLSKLKVQLEKLAGQESQLQEYKETITNQTGSHYQKLLQRLHPNVKVTSSSPTEWITLFEQQVVKQSLTNTNTSDLEARLHESQESQNKLQGQIQHYKTVLSDTEGILNKLQSSVEAEEKKWHQINKMSEEQLIKVKEENKRLQEELKNAKGSKEDLTDLDFAYRCVEKSLTNIVDEMDDKVKDMEVKLVETASEKHQLESTLRTDLEAVSSKLEEHEKKVKELASENVKLKANVKIGHDALKQEQDLVKQLQGQLSQKKGLANGTSSGDEVTQLRNKLIETQKQLEHEADSNKQLTQKLAVLVESKPGEDGTSV